MEELFKNLTISNRLETDYKKLSPVIAAVLSDQKKKEEGKLRYSNWADNGYKWSAEDYAHEGFRAIYTENLFTDRAKLVKMALKTAVDMSESNLQEDFFENIKTVASFGCGPGPDLTGFRAYVEDTCTLKIDTSSLEMTGYDAEKGWKQYHDELGTSFITKYVDKKFLDSMPEYDVIIMSYFAHSADFSTHKKDEPSNWDIVEGKSKLIIVLDVNDPHQNDSLENQKFTKFNLRHEHRVVYVHIKVK